MFAVDHDHEQRNSEKGGNLINRQEGLEGSPGPRVFDV